MPAVRDAARVDALHQRFRETGDRDALAALASEYDFVARVLARRFRSSGLELQDLLQTARVGLLQALHRFDPARGTRFVTFAWPTVTGELKRHVRDSGWPVHIPRGVKETAVAVRASSDDLTQALGRTPTARELASTTGVSERRVRQAAAARAARRCLSLDAPVRGSGSAREIGRHEPGFEEVERRATLDRLLPLLGDDDRLLVELWYFRGVNQTVIGRRVGCSQVHVSRRLQGAVRRLRAASRADVPVPARRSA